MFEFHPSMLQQSPPQLKQPVEVGHFSMDTERQVILDKSQLKYYCEPNSHKVSFDLTKGFDTFIDKNDIPEGTRKEYLDPLLRFLLVKNEDKTDIDFKRDLCFGADVVCWRGAITKIAHTPYENREGWKFSVVKIDDVIIMCEMETESKRQRELEMDEKGRIICYGGFKFEQYVTCETPGGEADLSQVVDTRNQFCSVVRTTLGQIRLLYGGETDCVHASTHKYIELKTSIDEFNPRITASFHRHKSVKWWLQSWLIGIETIVCGYRGNDSIVKRISPIAVSSLPKQAQGWSPGVCLNFLHNTLHSVNSEFDTIPPGKLHILEYDLNSVTFRPADLKDGPNVKFLPDWFPNSHSLFL